jgi:CubicO group peptidase (beta-lactamase class C family)
MMMIFDRFVRSQRALASATAVCAVAAGVVTIGQSREAPGPVARDIDAVLAAVYRPDGPGAAVIVVKNGRVVFRKAYGLANVELGVPMRAEIQRPASGDGAPAA